MKCFDSGSALIQVEALRVLREIEESQGGHCWGSKKGHNCLRINQWIQLLIVSWRKQKDVAIYLGQRVIQIVELWTINLIVFR